MIVINDDFRLLKGGHVKEGGLARNEAILDWLRANKDIQEIKLNRGRIENALITLKLLRNIENQVIYLFYPTLGVPILKDGMLGRLCSDLFFSALNIASKKNRVLIDICDLKYEQAIDLEIDKERLEAIEKAEKRLFGTACEFVYASESMKEYAKQKYCVSPQKCHVLDNGGNLAFKRTSFPDTTDKIKLIYAGTLNRGRCIESMIESMRNVHNAVLYLCGTGGEWIKEEDNIKNLGPLDESCAHYIVSQSDIGLIPYDSSKLYYNIAYPTKLAFYITAGIPFISTDVKEVRNIHQKYHIGYISDVDDWHDLFSTIDTDAVNDQKKKVRDIIDEFTWENKCNSSILAEI